MKYSYFDKEFILELNNPFMLESKGTFGFSKKRRNHTISAVPTWTPESDRTIDTVPVFSRCYKAQPQKIPF